MTRQRIGLVTHVDAIYHARYDLPKPERVRTEGSHKHRPADVDRCQRCGASVPYLVFDPRTRGWVCSPCASDEPPDIPA